MSLFQLVGQYPMQAAGIVADGPVRLESGIRDAVTPKIRQSVEGEYIALLADVGWFGRTWLRLEMKAEIERRVAAEVEEQSPSDCALF